MRVGTRGVLFWGIICMKQFFLPGLVHTPCGILVNSLDKVSF